MDAEALCDALIGHMKHEVALMQEMASHESDLKESIVNHDWTRLELSQRKTAPILATISEVEQARNEAFARLREAVEEEEEAGFYDVMLHLDDRRRDAAADVYRTLKFTVLKIQGMTNSIDVYLRTVTGAMQEILAELFPYRRGNIYTSNGKTSEARSNPMVFSRKL